MPKLKKLIQDIDLDNPELRVPRTMLLTNDTNKILVELAKAKILAKDIEPTQQIFNEKRINELANTWFKSGKAPQSVLLSLRKLALYSSGETVKEACIKEFLGHHPNLKVVERPRGRPPGYKSPELKLRLAMGEVIAELLNSNPNIYRKLLKAA